MMDEETAKRGFGQVQYRLGTFKLTDLIRLEANPNERWEIRQSIAPGLLVKMTISFEHCECKTVKECSACKRQFCLYCAEAFPPGTRQEVKSVGHVCLTCTAEGKSLFGEKS